LSGGREYGGSQLFTLAGPNGGLEGLAVLAPKKVQLRPFGRLGPAVTLSGYRLVADEVIAPGNPAALDAFVHSFCELFARREADCLLFEVVEVDSPLWQAIHQVARERRRLALCAQTRPAQPHYLVRFPDNPLDYWKKFSGKTRNTLRRKAGKLEHRLVRYTSPQEVPAFFEKAYQVSQTSWQTKRLGLRVGNDPQTCAVWSRVAALGGFRSYTLDHDGRPVAFVLGTCYNGFYRYEEVAYDQAYAQYSPGTVLLFKLIEDLIGCDPPRVLDFGFGEAEYKRLFATAEVRTGQVLLVRRALRPASALRLERLTARVSALAREGARRAGLLGLFRRLYRRAGGAAGDTPEPARLPAPSEPTA
jgi:hypothetical protein